MGHEQRPQVRSVRPKYLRPNIRPGRRVSVEDEVVLLCCGTRARRERTAPRVAELSETVDWHQLYRLLELQGLVALIGTRLLQIGASVHDLMRDRLDQTLAYNRRRAL